MEATVTLESCDFAIALQDIYDKVEFDTENRVNG